MNKLVFILFLLVTALTTAQTGKVNGTIIDKDATTENEPVAFASVVLKGTNYGAQSDFDGNFSISAPAGTYTLVVSFVGMKTVEIPEVVVRNGFTTTVNVEMSAEAASLEAVSIVVAKSREGTDVLLEEKKNAVTIKQSIGAEELSQKGVSDAEGAVTKVSGISKQAGVKNVFVRGLGDRYNSTTLNGLPLPSEDPEYKNISLDFFGSDLIETVDINKVFNAELTGDNAGANINIDLKGLTGRQALEVGVSTGANLQTLGEDFKSIDGPGYFGFTSPDLPTDNLRQYTFDNTINGEDQNGLVNLGFSLNGGKRIDIGDNYLNIYGLLTFDNGYRFVEGTVRNTTSAGTLYLDQDFVSYEYETSQIAQIDLDYRFNRNNIEFLSMYIHKNSQDFQEFQGIDNPEQTGDQVFVRRQQTNNNNLFVNQLLSEINLSDKLVLNVKGSFNAIRGSEPDRRSFEYLFRDGFYSPNLDSGGNNQRYFSEVQENDYNGIASLKYNFASDDSDRLNYITLGGEYRLTHHIFKATTFNHTFDQRVEVDINNPDGIYNQASLDAGNFRLETGRGSILNPNAFVPFYYIGDKYVAAGQATYVKNLTDNLLVTAGARFENVRQEVEYNTNIANSVSGGPAEIDENLFLPSVGFKYNVNEDNIIRLAGSKTYILPRFKEIAPFRYDNPGGTSTQGNPDLEISEVINLDLSYEFYPNKGEIFSITGFYKNINDPIARTEIPSAGNTLTYLNVGGTATVIGAELEIRKTLFENELTSLEGSDKDRSNSLAVGFNASYIYSKQDLENPLAQFTDDSTQLQGAAPFLTNFDVNYNTFLGNNNVNTALVFNYFTERVYSVGTRGFANIKEIGVPTLDFVGSIGVGDNGKLSLKAKNLLNPEYRLERDGDSNNTVLSEYKRGLDISLGYSYKF
ncbi:TonB-dependent receptor [Nonlabens marinus]|uniref:TonB-dependent receptor n=1 Tax=Nonlabens marinus S1-08 TaxID=1454201 RepID=W8VQH6_9FLAO|nr:TonB-dependent receptor [Nonlabens marinus]BAO55090.1 TonB-dependent receptor [Nonlabens marinus S1-08]